MVALMFKLALSNVVLSWNVLRGCAEVSEPFSVIHDVDIYLSSAENYPRCSSIVCQCRPIGIQSESTL